MAGCDESGEVIYQLSTALPKDEKYGLTSQMRRSAVSIPANIAEGYGRLHRGDYVHRLSFANGSLTELETLLTVAARLKLLERQAVAEVWEQTRLVGRELQGLLNSLKK